MNLKHEFNRIGHLVNDGVEKTSRATGTWMDTRAAGMAKQVRNQVDAQTRSLVTVEEKIVRHVRENPRLYLVGIALVIGALIAKLFMESRQTSSTPLV